MYHRYTDLLGELCIGEVNKREDIRFSNLLREGVKQRASEMLEENMQSKRKCVTYNE
jgi:hypothetical protein